MPTERLTEPTIPAAQLDLMHKIGYLHESELEIISSTTPRSRMRWKSPKGVMLGTEKYYTLQSVKQHLDALAAEVDHDADRI